MARVVRVCIRNSMSSRNNDFGIQQYGTQQRDIQILPTSTSTKIICPDGSRKTVQERLSLLEDTLLADDERTKEIASAGLFGTSLLSCELINLSSPADTVEHVVTSALLTLLISVTIVDNGYDFLKMASQLALSQLKVENKDRFQLPEKNSLPLNIGQGIITGSIIRGFTRLLTIDTVRESQCEAAALYMAYVLGLPCFPYRPNALEASVLVAESTSKLNMGDTSQSEKVKGPKNSDTDTDSIDNLLTSSGILRMLMWLYAPIAMEYMNHPQLIVSDPREASGFLKRLEDYYGGTKDTRLFWLDGSDASNPIPEQQQQYRSNLLKWAYMETEVMLRNNIRIIRSISEWCCYDW
jgi:hypothetical protein